MLTLELDPETEQQLAELLNHHPNTNQTELIKRLIRQHWLTLQLGKTIVERRGGHPQYLLENAPPDLSERANRKRQIATYLQNRHP